MQVQEFMRQDRNYQVTRAIESVVAVPAEISGLIADAVVAIEESEICVAIAVHINMQMRLRYMTLATHSITRSQVQQFKKMKTDESKYWREIGHRLIRQPSLTTTYLNDMLINTRLINEAAAEGEILYIAAPFPYDPTDF